MREPGHPGHGSHLRLTYKVEGKTFSESLSDGATARKAAQEIAEFRKFQQLSRDFVEVNARIGSRLKQSGMFWTVRGANAILVLRCCHRNCRFEDYWETRAARYLTSKSVAEVAFAWIQV